MKKSELQEIIGEEIQAVLEISMTKRFTKAVEELQKIQLAQQKLRKQFVAEKDPTKKEKLKQAIIKMHKVVQKVEQNFNDAIKGEPVEDIEEGKDSDGYHMTPLTIAAQNEHFQIVKYLIEQGEADPNIANSAGWNVLHLAAFNNRRNTDVILYLLTHISLDSVNKITGIMTPLDFAYLSCVPIRREIISLLRLKGGKANCHDRNGRRVERGNGDLND